MIKQNTPPLQHSELNSGTQSLDKILMNLVEQLNQKNQSLEALVNDPFNRLHSWDDCYSFFQTHWDDLSRCRSDSKVLNDATLQFAYYFASFGMYRGNAYLQCSKEIFKEPLRQVFRLIGQKHLTCDAVCQDPKIILEIDKTFKSALEKSIKQTGQEPAVSLLARQKFLLGVFAAVPAFDNQFKKALSKERKTHFLFKKLHPELTERNVKSICELQKALQECQGFMCLEPKTIANKKFPVIRKLDLIFWLLGKKISNS